MDKYTGCNIVESETVAKCAPHKAVKKNKRGQLKSLVLRLTVAALAIGAMFFIKYSSLAPIISVRQAIHTAFFYDIFGRTVGYSAFF